MYSQAKQKANPAWKIMGDTPGAMLGGNHRHRFRRQLLKNKTGSQYLALALSDRMASFSGMALNEDGCHWQ
jgi:hypothetical protein